MTLQLDKSEIRLPTVIRIPLHKNGPGVVSFYYVLGLLGATILWVLTSHDKELTEIYIALGILVLLTVPLFLYARYKSLILRPDGSFTIPGKEPTTIQKSDVLSFTTLDRHSYLFLGKGSLLLGIVDLDTYRKPELFQAWFKHHYGNLPSTDMDVGQTGKASHFSQLIGSPEFLKIMAVLLTLLAILLHTVWIYGS